MIARQAERPISILALGDERSGLAPIQLMMELDGHDYRKVEAIQEAVEVLKSERDKTDVVLVDLSVELGGSENIITQVRSADQHVPIVLVTGSRIHPHIDLKFRSLGVDHVFPKPYNPYHLADAIENARGVKFSRVSQLVQDPPPAPTIRTGVVA